ncbi:MAG: hypothetical protein HYX96_04210 [Chloroflexi bacterium]|nr:hypothetical protein [Chloroflexota bacterium]
MLNPVRSFVNVFLRYLSDLYSGVSQRANSYPAACCIQASGIFVAILLLMLGLLTAFPALATWFPNVLLPKY